jgi:5'-3' exonuclease
MSEHQYTLLKTLIQSIYPTAKEYV